MAAQSRRKMHRWRRWRRLFLLFLFAALLSLGVLYAGRLTLPRTTGTIVLSGIRHKVDLYRDGKGVVTIKAETPLDAYYALGFAHAQDRLFQMDLQRRASDGRLSEIMGPGTLPLDREMRALSLSRHAEAAEATLTPEFRAVLDAYSAGVNGFIATVRPLPLEFSLLSYHPEPWRPADTLKIAKLLAFELSGNYRQEMLRARLSARLSPEQLDQLFPASGPDSLAPLAPLNELYRDVPFDRLLAGLKPLVGPLPVDTAWMVDGAHSATGHPLIGRTPKLDANGPGIWYLARMDAPGLSVAGSTLAGTPFTLTGYNAQAAWIATPIRRDVEDLFIEEIDPADPTRYLTPDGSKPFETRVETILIRGQTDPERITMRRTRHGPVLSDAISIGKEKSPYLVALQAVFLADRDDSAEALWRLSLSGTWGEAVRAADSYLAPPLTLLFAERSGTIGSLVLGAVPVRAGGDGRAPVPGRTGAFDWTLITPTSRQVPVIDPPDGQITLSPEAKPEAKLTDMGPNGERTTPSPATNTERAARALVASPPTAKQNLAPLRETPSATATALIPLLLAVPPQDNRQRAAYALLGTWDRIIRPDRPEAALFVTWLKYLDQRIYADELGALFPEYRRLNPGFVREVLTKYPQWCDQTATQELETCNDLIRLSLNDALDELTARQGQSMDAWQIETTHRTRFTHPALSHLPFIGFLFEANQDPDDEIEPGIPGGLSVANPVNPRLDLYGTGVRSLLDLSDPDRSVFMIASGQSAQLLSPHYADLLPQWRAFEWLRLPHLVKGDPLTLVPPP